jgi:hypothetical protein
MTVIDPLYDEAAEARQIIGAFKPAMSKADYLSFARFLFKKERYSRAGMIICSCARGGTDGFCRVATCLTKLSHASAPV